jgi:uncharacterized repeat protein (TIGR01451 family)
MKAYKQNFLLLFLVTAFLLLASAAASAEEGAIRFSNKAFKQVISKSEDGTVQYDYVEPKLVLPDDIILYEIEFENISDKEVSNIVVNNPIANNSKYRAGSAAGDSSVITFSVDGKVFASAGELVVKDQSGQSQKAKPGDYTVIRWIYKKVLKPGEKGKVTYKTSIK